MHSMSNSNVVLRPLVFFLVSTSVFSPKWIASGSPADQEPKYFKRTDPLTHFNYYNGGYDVRNRHYWVSAAFTGVHAYAIAGVWLLCGLGFGIFLTVKNPSGSSWPFIKQYLDRDHNYILMFLLVLLFTFLAIVASSFVLAANQSTLWRTEKMKGTILKMGGDAHQTIQKVMNAMTEMQSILLPYDPITSRTLKITTHRLGRESHVIHNFVDKSGHSIDQAIHTSYIAHLVIVTINLVMLVAALVLLLLHWHHGIIFIIFCCWILATICWILTGIDFFLDTFAEDTCSAFADFEENPHNNSLSSILPCMNPSSSKRIMVDIGYTIHTHIAQLNSKITDYYKSLGSDEQSEGFVGVRKICEPFSGAPSYSYMPESCPKDAIPVADLPNVLARFTCYQNKYSSGECESDGRFLPEACYNMVSAYSRSVQYVIDVHSDLQSLTECSFVKNRLSEVVSHQCQPFKVSIRFLWSSMLALSIVMVLLVLIWVAKAYQDRGRSFSLCSITPNIIPR
ncbi:uncharacterized protein LOC121249058 [Juglans microcarpa x Juglans regia]|uniref:uncharacterized protein LOC121249058 n=1 Tax=Juglans microcarpa x Juglans regia TaxID=2249226 RepID=UPI001B7E9C3B|nr:uncharacterized protein LOC121249058 [Juglans microcarpa x Juglans regia]